VNLRFRDPRIALKPSHLVFECPPVLVVADQLSRARDDTVGLTGFGRHLEDGRPVVTAFREPTFTGDKIVADFIELAGGGSRPFSVPRIWIRMREEGGPRHPDGAKDVFGAAAGAAVEENPSVLAGGDTKRGPMVLMGGAARYRGVSAALNIREPREQCIES
jgi:hypothetical protein